MGRRRQAREANWLGWIDKRNTVQVNWALNHLLKKGLQPIQNHSNEFIRLNSISEPQFHSVLARDRFIDLMKKAWKAKRTRDIASRKRGVQAFQTYLSKEALNALEKLKARTGTSKNQILETLILSSHQDLKNFAPSPIHASQHGTMTINRIASAGRYAFDNTTVKSPEKNVASESNTRLEVQLAEAHDLIDQLKSEMNEAKTILAKFTSLVAHTSDIPHLDLDEGATLPVARDGIPQRTEASPETKEQGNHQEVAVPSTPNDTTSDDIQPKDKSESEGFWIGEVWHPRPHGDVEIIPVKLFSDNSDD